MEDLRPCEITDEAYWKRVIETLTISARILTSGIGWFRGESNLIKGKEPHDYVYDAIDWYFANPGKFQPERGAFTTFLKQRIMTLIHNDLTSKENRTTVDPELLPPKASGEDENEHGDYLEQLVSGIETCIDDQIDTKSLLSEVQSEISAIADSTNREILENIYMGLSEGLKRAEIIETFQIQESEYNNAIRRLNTIGNQVKRKMRIPK